MNLLQTIRTIEKVAKAIPNVNTVVSTFEDLNREDTVYSAVIIQQQSHTHNDDWMQYNFYIGYADRLVEDGSNELSVQSTAMNNIHSIVRALRNILSTAEISYSNTNVFAQRFTALCAGAYETVSIILPISECDDSNEGIPGLDSISTTITENGDYRFVPDGLGFDSVHIVVDIPPFPTPEESFDVKPTTTDQTITPREGYAFGSGTVRAVTSDIDENITTDNIRKGVTILGVEGTFKGEKPEERFEVQPKTTDQTITPTEGSVFSGGTVKAVTSEIDENITTDNIKKGVTILGVEGTFKGEKPEEEFDVRPTTTDQKITPREGYAFGGGTVRAVTSDIDENIVADNIREGAIILGVEGTFKGEKPEESFNVRPTTFEQTITPRDGYAFGSGTVKAVTAEIDDNIVPNNIREGVTVLGVEGTLKEVKPEESFVVQPKTTDQTITPNEGSVFKGGTVKAVTADIDKNIVPNNVREGVTVLGVKGTLKEVKPEERFVVQPSTAEQTITPQDGYVFSEGTIKAVTADIDKDIKPVNIREGISILGVEGTLKEVKPEEEFDIQPSTTDQTITPTEGSVFSKGTVRAVTSDIDKNIVSNNIREGVTVLGVEGTLKEVKPEESFDVQPSTVEQTITPREGYAFGGGTVRAVTAEIDENIIANNIREGVTVLGVEGTLKEVKPEETFNVQPSTVEQIITPSEGSVFSRGTVKAVTSTIDNNIQPENIREGVTVLGVEGTLIEEKPNYRYMSGDVDRNGLRALGWTEDDILCYEQNTPHYPWQNDQYIVSDANKNLYNLDDPTPDSYKNDPTITFVPNKKMDTYFNSGTFENMKYIKGLPFYNCTRTDMTNMFCECSNLTTIPFLDTSNVTEMTYLFSGCSNLITVPQLNTSKVTHMGAMFAGCRKLATIPLLDTSHTKYMAYMFQACKSLTEVPQMDTSNALDVSHMFMGCSLLTSIPMLNTSKATAMHGMFYGCTNLTEVPQLNTSSATVMSGMFENCTSLTTIPLLNTSNVTDARSMFYGCRNLTTVPQMDLSSATDVMDMFYGCTNLTEVPQMDLSRAKYVNDMFNGCTSLTTVHPLNSSRAIEMKNVFAGCTSLTTVEGINFSGVELTLTNLFGTSTSMPNITRFIVNGWIDANVKDNYSIAALTAIDYDSVKSILEAADRTTRTNSRTLAFNRTMSDPDGELSYLVSSCMSKGWKITGLTLQ